VGERLCERAHASPRVAGWIEVLREINTQLGRNATRAELGLQGPVATLKEGIADCVARFPATAATPAAGTSPFEELRVAMLAAADRVGVQATATEPWRGGALDDQDNPLEPTALERQLAVVGKDGADLRFQAALAPGAPLPRGLPGGRLAVAAASSGDPFLDGLEARVARCSLISRRHDANAVHASQDGGSPGATQTSSNAADYGSQTAAAQRSTSAGRATT
jgi:hypothetical protein